jgi:hypothetical protein
MLARLRQAKLVTLHSALSGQRIELTAEGEAFIEKAKICAANLKNLTEDEYDGVNDRQLVAVLKAATNTAERALIHSRPRPLSVKEGFHHFIQSFQRLTSQRGHSHAPTSRTSKLGISAKSGVSEKGCTTEGSAYTHSVATTIAGNAESPSFTEAIVYISSQLSFSGSGPLREPDFCAHSL